MLSKYELPGSCAYDVARIAQGKYNKVEYRISITPQEEEGLRNLAINTMIKMITYMDMYLSNEQKEGQPILIVGKKYEHLTHRESKLYDLLQTIDNNRKQKNRINDAIQKFNLKVTNGLKEFQEMGIYKEGES
jgi:hypothetical protein